jgi:hypothetical protein
MQWRIALSKLMTRKGLVEFANRELGIPLSESVVDKAPPKADWYYGRRDLYSEETARKYAESLVTKKPNRLIPDSKTTAA